MKLGNIFIEQTSFIFFYSTCPSKHAIGFWNILYEYKEKPNLLLGLYRNKFFKSPEYVSTDIFPGVGAHWLLGIVTAPELVSKFTKSNEDL